MLTSVFIIGPFIELVNTWYMALGFVLISLTIFFVKPTYPAQLNLTEKEVYTNNRRKKRVLLILVLLQCIGSIALDQCVAIYGALGMFTALTALFVEKFARRKNSNEKNRRCLQSNRGKNG